MPAFTTKAQRSVRVYADPHEDAKVLGAIPAGRLIEVIDQNEEWLLVQDMRNQNLRGYVSWQVNVPAKRRTRFRRRVTNPRRPAPTTIPSGPPEQETKAELVDDTPETKPPKPAPPPPPPPESPAGADLAPPKNQQLTNAKTYLEKATAKVWNKYGGILTSLAEQYGIDPAVAVAVMAVESGGTAFGPQNRMIIRFENHLFWRNWGKNNPDTYKKHFKFDQNQQWKGHVWRKDPNGQWESFHGNQEKEWTVYMFAKTFKAKAARMSISMGLPQVLGSNYKRLGYRNVGQMEDAFNDPTNGERHQVTGLFKFVKSDATNRGIPALRNQDFVSFAKMYNGSGQAQTYGKLIAERYRIIKKLRGG